MITLLNIFNTIADSNLAYYLLVLILVIIAISMIYLIYSQNKEIEIAKKKNREEINDNTIPVGTGKENNDMVENLVKEIRDEQVTQEQIDEKLEHTMNTPIRESIIKEIDKADEASLNTEYPVYNIYEEAKEYNKDDDIKLEKVEEDITKSSTKKEIMEATMTDIPRVNLLDETITALPPLMEYSDSTQELIDLTKKLETVPRERAVKLTLYEEEQEQNAIISYDELVNSTDGVIYKDEVNEENLNIKQVDLDKTTKIEMSGKQIPKETYAHEELFLRKLKSLQSKMN